MAEHFGYSKLTFLILLTCSSLFLNILTVTDKLFLHGGIMSWKPSWTKIAAQEAEAVASFPCSGHGKPFLDGLLVNGRPVCECDACFTGPDCSQPVQDCIVDADSGDPMFLEPFWQKHAARSTIVVPGWHRMSYEFNDGSLISQELKTHILKLHDLVGNVKTRGKFIIFGAGATQLLNAAVHALSSRSSSVLASVPYYPVYREQTKFFQSEIYKFGGDTSSWKKNLSSSTREYVEIVTSPNNPDGQLKKPVLDEQPNVKTIHDLAYYWPHFTAIPSPIDEDLMIFTLSKLTGHAGSRFGWALIKDEKVYQRMLDYMSLSTYGVSRETQLRVLKLLKVVMEEGDGKEMFEFGSKTMASRWQRLSATLSSSNSFSLQKIDNLHCSYSKSIRKPSPAFAWIKCEREEDKDCYKTLKEANIIGRKGRLFGSDTRFVRLSLVKSQHEFELLIQQLKSLVQREKNPQHITEVKTASGSGPSRSNSSANATWPFLIDRHGVGTHLSSLYYIHDQP